MRILLCAQFYAPITGGEERHVRTLGLGMYQRGHDVDVLTIAPDPSLVGVADDEGLRVVRVASAAQRLPRAHSDTERPHSLPVADPQVRHSAARLAAERSYDIVHAHNWIAGSVLGVARRHGVPLIMTLHDYSHVCAVKRYMREGRECEGPSLARCPSCAHEHYGRGGAAIAAANWFARSARERRVNEFLAVSSAVAERNGLPLGNAPYQVLPNFIPEAILADPLAAPGPAGPHDPLVYVGDLTRDKGVEVLLAAYGRLTDRPPLVLAGRPGDARLELPAGARVVEQQPHAEVLELMRSARAVVVPSVWPDPCPTVVLEAMAQGRPVVAARSGGIVDMLQSGRNGLLVAPGDAAALARALDRISTEPELAARLGRQARLDVVRFTDGQVVPLIESVYRRHVGAAQTTSVA